MIINKEDTKTKIY